MTNTYIQDKLDEFDKQFGNAGEERNCDSIGRWAGCDDCEENIELRDEHRKYVEQSLTDYQNHIVEKLKDYFDEQGVQEFIGTGAIELITKDKLQDTNTKE